MYYRRIAKFIITFFLSVFLYCCETTSDKDSSKSQKLYTTFQEIVNDVNSGEIIDLDKYSEKYIITDYNAEINKWHTVPACEVVTEPFWYSSLQSKLILSGLAEYHRQR